MENYPISTNREKQLPLPNPATQKQHRKEVVWQVLIPIIVLFLILLGVGFWFYNSEVGSISTWADISVILLSLPVLIFGLLILLMFVFFIIIINYLLKFLPPYARLTQNSIETLEQQIKAGADISAKPIIQIQSFISMIQTLLGK